jgi:hypothetical protein
MAEPVVAEIVEGERVMAGAAGLIVIEKLTDVVTVALSVTVTPSDVVPAVVGVPEIKPVELILNPFGSEPELIVVPGPP